MKKTPKSKINKSKNHKITKLSTRVTKFLDKAKVKYKILEHKVVYTAHDVGATTKKKLGEIAKVVLVKADRDFVLMVLPAGKYVDLKAVQKVLASAKGGPASGAKKVSLAGEKDITKYLKTKIGLLHPFGSEYNLKTLLDNGLAKAKKIIASAGTYTDSVELAVKDFEKLVKPVKGNFSKAKK